MCDHSPLLQAILRHAIATPNKMAVIIGESEISYSSFEENLRKCATALSGLGIGVGSKIILSARKEMEYLYVYFASQLLGAMNVIVDAESNRENLKYMEDAVHPDYCIGYRSDTYPSALFRELKIESSTPFTDVVSSVELTQDSVGEILFTTGTTGHPKGVCLSYRNIYSSAVNMNEFIRNNEDDIELLALPLCHSFGLGRMRSTLLKGATIVILGNFANVRMFLSAMERYHVTGFGVVPAAWAYIRKISGTRIRKFSSQIRYIEIGSASMSKKTKKEMLEMFPNTRICMHYGLTEASRSTFLEFHDESHLDSIGTPVNGGVDVKVINGEICVKGDHVMSRYLNNPESEDAFIEGYFRTGDSGTISKDGYVYLQGRMKELINVGGKKVSPAEVENAICSIGVGDCVCVPIKDERDMMGELVKCYVLRGSTTLTFEEIAEGLLTKLEAYKRPVAYEWIDVIPLTSSGKKQRTKVS